MIIYIVATWIDLHSFTCLRHHVPFLHPSASFWITKWYLKTEFLGQLVPPLSPCLGN